MNCLYAGRAACAQFTASGITLQIWFTHCKPAAVLSAVTARCVVPAYVLEIDHIHVWPEPCRSMHPTAINSCTRKCMMLVGCCGVQMDEEGRCFFVPGGLHAS